MPQIDVARQGSGFVDAAGREYRHAEVRETGWIDPGPAAVIAVLAFLLGAKFLEQHQGFGWTLVILAPVFWMGRKRTVVDSRVLSTGPTRKTTADREKEAAEQQAKGAELAVRAAVSQDGRSGIRDLVVYILQNQGEFNEFWISCGGEVLAEKLRRLQSPDAGEISRAIREILPKNAREVEVILDQARSAIGRPNSSRAHVEAWLGGQSTYSAAIKLSYIFEHLDEFPHDLWFGGHVAEAWRNRFQSGTVEDRQEAMHEFLAKVKTCREVKETTKKLDGLLEV